MIREKILIVLIMLSLAFLFITLVNAPTWFTSSTSLNETGTSFVNTSYNSAGFVELAQTEYKGYPYNSFAERFLNINRLSIKCIVC